VSIVVFTMFPLMYPSSLFPAALVSSA